MKNIAFISEILPLPQRGENPETEVHTAADSSYDEDHEFLKVRLTCSLHPRGGGKQQIEATWLPRMETVIEKVSLEEALPATKDVFHNWVARVRRAIAVRYERWLANK